jgi:hypothetical protein
MKREATAVYAGGMSMAAKRIFDIRKQLAAAEISLRECEYLGNSEKNLALRHQGGLKECAPAPF